MKQKKNLRQIVSSVYDPYYNIALETVLFERIRDGEIILYLWRNNKTVVIGKNQSADECNIHELNKIGGKLARRLSGGGAVYHDLNNLNFTFIAKDGLYDEAVQNMIILNALKKFDINAEISGRNDITVDGRKFSGNAYLHNGDRHMRHGTILIKTDIEIMQKVLNVSDVKLHKGVKSVPGRVVNLSDLCKKTNDMRTVINAKTLGDMLISGAEAAYGRSSEFDAQSLDGERIEKLRRLYSSDGYILGEKFEHDERIVKRFDFGVGDVRIKYKHGKIDRIKLYTDSLETDIEQYEKEVIDGL